MVEQPVEYRVVTPSLESEWYNIVPFDPPVLEFATRNFIPPAYMKLDESTHQGFGYVKVPEGSQISLQSVAKIILLMWVLNFMHLIKSYP